MGPVPPSSNKGLVCRLLREEGNWSSRISSRCNIADQLAAEFVKVREWKIWLRIAL
jgi:hypothetical protein